MIAANIQTCANNDCDRPVLDKGQVNCTTCRKQLHEDIIRRQTREQVFGNSNDKARKAPY